MLALDKLAPADRARFEGIGRGVVTPSAAEPGTPLPEPHPSWMERIEEEWKRRYVR